MNRYQECAAAVEAEYVGEKAALEKRGTGSTERLAHLDETITSAHELVDRLEDADSVDSGVGIVNVYEQELRVNLGEREGSSEILACLRTRDALEKMLPAPPAG